MLVYIIKVSISLAIFYLLYRVVFVRYTFFSFNRIYLLCSLVLSLLLPVLNLPQRSISGGQNNVQLGIDWDQVLAVRDVLVVPDSEVTSFQPLSVMAVLYFLTVFLLLMKAVLNFRQTRERFSNGHMEKLNGIKWNVHPDVHSPFTLFRTVYLDQDTFTKEDSLIVRHEEIHAKQLHSLDLLFIEIICAFLWFNPFVFLIKKRMQDNHEYLADQKAHKGSEELIAYMQELSLELTKRFDPAFASCFNSSTLKKRIIMLTNKKSNSKKRWVYLSILPLIAILTMAFQQGKSFSVLELSAASIIPNTEMSETIVSISEKPSRFPLDDKHRDNVSWKYGHKRWHPILKIEKVHKGVDFRADIGTPIYATADGMAAKVEVHKGYGKMILIEHDGVYASLYAHMDEFSIEEGDWVKKGQQIGTVGNTGFSTGPHLHYEVLKDGENVDPADYY